MSEKLDESIQKANFKSLSNRRVEKREKDDNSYQTYVRKIA